MARWPFSPPGAPPAPRLRRWCGSRAIVGPSRMDLRRRRMNWDLTIMRPALGTAGTGTSRWSCWQGLRMKIAEIFDGMEFGVVRGVFLRSGGPHVGKDFGGRILGLGRPPLWRHSRAPAD